MTIDPTELARLKAALHEWHAEALSQNANPLSSQLLSLFRVEADRNPVTRITDEAAYRILDEIEYSRAYMTIASQNVVLALIAEVERLRRLTLAVKAPCHQCGDSLAKCVATMCCVGCNHATKTGDADDR